MENSNKAKNTILEAFDELWESRTPDPDTAQAPFIREEIRGLAKIWTDPTDFLHVHKKQKLSNS